jgi:hypothetical protein
MADATCILLPRSSQTQQEIEPLRADARSHAARISHHRRQRRQERKQGTIRFSVQADAELAAGEKVAHGNGAHIFRHIYPGPQTLLGQDKLDHFKTSQHHALPPVLHESLERAYEVFWPRNMLGLPDYSLRHAILSWWKFGLSEPMVSRAQIANAANMAYVIAESEGKRLTLFHLRKKPQTIAFQLVQRAICILGDGTSWLALISCVCDLVCWSGVAKILKGGVQHRTCVLVAPGIL